MTQNTPQRTVRVSDTAWTKLKAVCSIERTNPSRVLKEAIADFTEAYSHFDVSGDQEWSYACVICEESEETFESLDEAITEYDEHGGMCSFCSSRYDKMTGE
jgi:predicted transcriptional regulator